MSWSPEGPARGRARRVRAGDGGGRGDGRRGGRARRGRVRRERRPPGRAPARARRQRARVRAAQPAGSRAAPHRGDPDADAQGAGLVRIRGRGPCGRRRERPRPAHGGEHRPPRAGGEVPRITAPRGGKLAGQLLQDHGGWFDLNDLHLARHVTWEPAELASCEALIDARGAPRRFDRNDKGGRFFDEFQQKLRGDGLPHTRVLTGD